MAKDDDDKAKAAEADKIKADAEAKAEADKAKAAEAKAEKAKADAETKAAPAAALDELAAEFARDPTLYADFSLPAPVKTIAEHWKHHPTRLPDGQHAHPKSNAVYTIQAGKLVKVAVLDPDKAKGVAARAA